MPAAGSSSAYVNEIQIISTSSEHQWEVQQITITPSGAGALSGSFRLRWNGQGPTAYMPLDEYDEFVEVCARRRELTTHAQMLQGCCKSLLLVFY